MYEWVNTARYKHTTEHFSTLKREKILKHAIKLTGFENIMLISQSQRINIVGQNSQIIKTEIKMVVVRNQEQRGLESCCLIRTEFLFGKMKSFGNSNSFITLCI